MRVLLISHNGLTEPLGQRQVLPYVLGLGRKGWRFHVLSFEKPATREAREQVLHALEVVGARWTPLTYHRRPPALATLYDVSRGLLVATSIGLRPGLVHARSTVPAVMASALGRWYRVPWIFDVRGLLAREYVDAGHWTSGGIRHRLTDWAERRLMASASGLIFLTRRIVADMTSAGCLRSGAPIEVVPCGVDLNTFHPDDTARGEIRNSLGLGDSPLLVYSGSLGSWYRIDEMIAFLLAARKEIRGLRFLILTRQIEVARTLLERLGLTSEAMVLSLDPHLVPRHLAAADVGICFIGDLPSKRASSPTKYGEYLASGLPVVTNRWTGDAATLDGERPWVLVDACSEDAYRKAARRLTTLLTCREQTALAARALAEREFGLATAIERYDRLYRQVLRCGP